MDVAPWSNKCTEGMDWIGYLGVGYRAPYSANNITTVKITPACRILRFTVDSIAVSLFGWLEEICANSVLWNLWLLIR